MIEIREVSKAFGSTRAVQGVSFSAVPGQVTGFLGPNGAGKTTTLRILLGLARADAGTALIDGATYMDLASPRRAVGAVVDSMGYHPGRTGRNHLLIISRSAGVPISRVEEVLDFVELTAAGDRNVGGYSHGMKRRLALAGALLGDPSILVLDEPANGLDPAGIAWLRRLVRDWAGQGRTVLFSSHNLGEVESVADKIVIIDHGRIVREATTGQLAGEDRAVAVRTPDAVRLGVLAELEDWRIRADGSDRFAIHGATATEIGHAAAREGIVLTELTADTPSGQLEELFLELTDSTTITEAGR